MKADNALLTAIAAFFSGRGYYTTIRKNIFMSDHSIDVASALPVIRELQSRINIGFAPCGVLQYVLGGEWISVKEIVETTGYSLSFVGTILEEAQEDGWIELDLSGEPRCRSINYRAPARECVFSFDGTRDFEKKLQILEDMKGVFNQAYFIFPFPIDKETTEMIVSKGYGILRFYEKQGAFVEIVPSELFDVEDKQRFAVLVENILFENMWLRRDEII